MRYFDSTEVKASDRPTRTRTVPRISALQEPEAPSLADDEEDFFWRARRTDGEHGLYHVVCRECTVEALCDSQPDAEWLEDVHETASGHHVDYAEVTRP